jgi:hypothetical protein
MPPCEKRICSEITEAYKPWAKDKGIVSLFHDSYARVGYLGVLWSKNDRIKAMRAARRTAKYVPSPRSISNSTLRDYSYTVASHLTASNTAKTFAV